MPERKCFRFNDSEFGVIWSLPADVCEWSGHSSAVDEAGFCPVCQHDHSPSGECMVA